jgi:hypothetical protein
LPQVLAFFGNLSGFNGYNIGMAITLMWGTYIYEDTEPLFVGIASLGLSIILDVTFLSIYGGDIVKADCSLSQGSLCGTPKFAAAMTIMALLVKPFTMYVALREFSRRGGDVKQYVTFLPNVGGAPASQGGYTGISNDGEAEAQAPPPSSPGGAGDGYQKAGIDAVPF